MLHQSVLLVEAIESLNIKPFGIYIDATFGRGGHAKNILCHLGAEGRLIVMDRDNDAIEAARELFQSDDRVMIVHDSFENIAEHINEHGLSGKIDGILFDLGVSSPQLDEAHRGFSFLREGPLDMRMDQSQSLTADSWIHGVSEPEMIRAFREFGEERYAPRIAKAIIEKRKLKKIQTTTELAELIKLAHPKWEKNKHPATRCFQAIRIAVNNEFMAIKKALEASLDVLAVGGRLVVISFHSLEDGLVKSFIQEASNSNLPDKLPILEKDIKRRIKKIGKLIRAESCEVETNIRSRSALLRVAEKLM